jgi:phosphate transport system substrate-binding protein
MVIVTRSLSKEEEKFYVDSFHLTPTEGPLAYDAIAVLVHPGVKDSIFDMSEIRDMLNGKDTQHQPVMDGLSATSTVRYAIDSILKGQPLGKNVRAAESSMAVVDYVANNPRAVGFIGVSWVGDRNDPGDTTFSKKVNVAAVECTSCLGKTYVRPFQANIAWKRYPMVRSLYYILKENYSGVGNNFANFLQYERGQLIFRRAYLWPARMTLDQQSVEMSK